MKNKALTWYELVENKTDFQKIQTVLCRYYKQFETPNTSQSAVFREKLSQIPVRNCKIFIKKFSRFDFQIYAEIREKDTKEADFWTHIDGIAEERELFQKSGNLDHPVFRIVCMSDLYENYCIPARENIEEYIQNK